MVRSWLLNTLSKEIVEAFYYSVSARDLWIELEARCNCGGCTCDIGRQIAELNTSNQLVQFLMGLDDAYDHVRSQILLLEPLPQVAKAYSMILRVEKQRLVTEGLNNAIENVAYQVKAKEPMVRFGGKKKLHVDKRNLYCENCQKPGHAKETCFKIYGTPDWYKQLIEQKRKNTPARGLVANVDDKSAGVLPSQELNELVQMWKMMKGRIPTDPVTVNFAQTEEFAGTISSQSKSDLCSWIIDTGATSHICADITLFDDNSAPNTPQFIRFPDGSQKPVTHVGKVKLSESIILSNVLHIPGFKVNLLSVSQLCSTLPISFVFDQSQCILQDQVTRDTLAIGRKFQNLYLLNPHSFSFSTASKMFQDNSVHSVSPINSC